MVLLFGRKLFSNNAKIKPLETFTFLSNRHASLFFSNLVPDEEKLSCNSYTVSYLTSSCGLSLESATKVSKSLRLETTERPDSVLNFFRSCSFSDALITNIIQKQPTLLLADPDSMLKPKFEFFASVGAHQSAMEKIVLACPSLLLHSMDKKVVPRFECLKSLQQTDESVVASIEKHPWLIMFNPVSTVLPNVAVLRDSGVPESSVRKFFKNKVPVLMQNPVRFKEIVEEVRKMGFDPSKCTFRTAICALKSINKHTWQRKLDVFRRWGWSDNDLLSAFRRQPNFMSLSVEGIEKKMNFFINTMGLDSLFVARHPNILLLSLEKRIIPRFTFIQTLVLKGLIENDVNFHTEFATTDYAFINKYVTKYGKKVPELFDLYSEK